MRANELLVRRRVHFWLMLGLLVAFDVASSSTSQSDQRITVSANGARPLASAIETLERRYGWVITYEDPPYLYPSEIEDVTVAVHKTYDPTKPRVLVPRGVPFNFEYALASTGVEPDQSVLLERLLEEYRFSGNPGLFRLLRTGSIFHVVPSESKNSLGLFELHSSLLDANISIGQAERTAFQMLKAITDAISKTGAATVTPGTVPANLLLSSRLQEGAKDESARTVLLRTLEATRSKLSWQLFCDPGAIRVCALNIHGVGRKAGP